MEGHWHPAAQNLFWWLLFFHPECLLEGCCMFPTCFLKSQWTAENIWPSLERKYRENVIHCTQGLSVGYLFNEKQLTYPG